MTSDEARYRLALAKGHLEEARQDLQLGRWRSCASNSQLAAENAAKAVLALIGPVGRTHEPGDILLQALEEGRFPDTIRVQVRRIAECAERLGPEVHIRSAYGDEANLRTPWGTFRRAQGTGSVRSCRGISAPVSRTG
ncbi:MAG: HEPN domain-containing protein [Armatimonadetes bacterium]|nr:HEPN domain-containing protein [Armatimonadota bacterium]